MTKYQHRKKLTMTLMSLLSLVFFVTKLKLADVAGIIICGDINSDLAKKMAAHILNYSEKHFGGINLLDDSKKMRINGLQLTEGGLMRLVCAPFG